MQTFLFWLAVVTLLGVASMAWRLILGDRQLRRLRDLPPPENIPQWPKISLIVPARNEERHVEPAMRSLLQLDYENLEVIAIDDRSTDKTGEILDRLAGSHPRLRVVHVTDLPPRWLGKNHALQRGADLADGEWLLFTDGDVLFDPSVLRRALGYVWSNQLDHLAIAPEPVMPTWLLQACVTVFAMYFGIFTRLGKVQDPRSSAHVGIGAFNLVRAAVYRQAGGHGPLAMRPDDDLKLGKLLKQNGCRQGILKGVGLLRVPWYGSVGELIVGLEKNTFAAMEYSVVRTLASATTVLLLNVWPFVAPCVTPGPARWLNLSAAAILLLLSGRAAVGLNAPWSCALGFPVGATLMAYITCRSMVLTLLNRGIRWRDTHYPLTDLKANRI